MNRYSQLYIILTNELVFYAYAGEKKLKIHNNRVCRFFEVSIHL